MKRRAVLTALAAGAGGAASAQEAAKEAWPSPFARKWHASFVEHWKDTREYSLAVLEAMPEDGYTSKPNPAQMSFGEQMRHHAAANVAYFDAFGLVPRPEILKNAQATPAGSKEAVRKYAEASFDFVLDVLGRMSERDLSRADLVLRPGTPPHSGIDICLRAYTHTAHHRGQAVVYLRVRGITPPAWKFEPKA
jgi:uncharacterized damage-inducible protein DinB